MSKSDSSFDYIDFMNDIINKVPEAIKTREISAELEKTVEKNIPRVCEIELPVSSSNHEKKINKSLTWQVQCKICKKRYYKREKFARHLLSHRSLLYSPYICPICNKELKFEIDFEKHLSLHATVRRFECPICHDVFKTVIPLKKHLEIHAYNYPYKCQLCGNTLSSARNLLLHWKRVHIMKEVFKCQKCKQDFPSEIMHHNHLYRAHKMTSCENCMKKFNSPASLKNHMLFCGKEIKGRYEDGLICPICSKPVVRSFLEQHSKKFHSPEDRYACKICFCFFPSSDQLKNHNLLKHTSNGTCNEKNIDFFLEKGNNKAKKPYCTFCSKVFANQLKLNLHAKRCHSQKKTNFCHLCKFSHSSLDKLMRHISQMHGVKITQNVVCENSSNTAKNVGEKSCPRPSMSLSDANTTLKPTIILLDIMYPCAICSKSVSGLYNYAQHMKMHLKNKIQKEACTGSSASDNNGSNQDWLKSYPCEKCQKSFSSSAYLICHLSSSHKRNSESVSDKKKHASEVCSLDSQLWAIKTLTHYDDTPHKCMICDAKFASYSHLEYHEGNVHSEIYKKPDTIFRCGVCAKKFSTKVELKLHMKCHTNDRPYTCRICMMSIDLLKNFNTHMRNEHPPYFCEKCSIPFSEYSAYVQHNYTKHSDKNKPAASEGNNSKHEKQKLNQHFPNFCDKSSIHLSAYDARISDKLEKHNLLKHATNETCNKKNINSFLVKGNDEVKKICCTFCSKVFTNEFSWRLHAMRCYSQENTNFCHLCKFSHSSLDKLMQHISQKHRENKTQNEVCEKSEMLPVETSHKASNSNNLNLYSTLTCTLDFNLYAQKLYPCEICRISFSSFNNYKQHAKTHTENNTQNPMDPCSLAANSTDLNPNVPKISNGGNMKCAVLNNVSHGNYQKSKLHECEVCKMNFGIRTDLDDHVRVQHRFYFCKECPMTFYGFERYSRHYATAHSRKKPLAEMSSNISINDSECSSRPVPKLSYPCDRCRNSFENESDFSLHKLSHMEDEPSIESTIEAVEIDNTKMFAEQQTPHLAELNLNIGSVVSFPIIGILTIPEVPKDGVSESFVIKNAGVNSNSLLAIKTEKMEEDNIYEESSTQLSSSTVKNEIPECQSDVEQVINGLKSEICMEEAVQIFKTEMFRIKQEIPADIICKTEFSLEMDQTLPNISGHAQKLLHPCDMCIKSFSEESKLLKHKLNVHSMDD